MHSLPRQSLAAVDVNKITCFDHTAGVVSGLGMHIHEDRFYQDIAVTQKMVPGTKSHSSK